MGNTVIAGILFQPPSPPNPLDYLGPDENKNTNGGNNSAVGGNEGDNAKKPPAKKRSHNISVDYLWLYSQNDDGEFLLIPAIHVTHDKPDASNGGAGGQPQAQAHHQAQAHKYTLLYSHGNAEDLGLIASFLSDLARLLQVNVMCYDYSGYGVGTDEGHVAEFWRGYGREVEAWKVWRNQDRKSDGDDGRGKMASVTAGNGRRCRFSRELFAAPLVRPPAGMMADDKEDDKEGDDDATSLQSVQQSMHDLVANACFDASNANGSGSDQENSLAGRDDNKGGGSPNEGATIGTSESRRAFRQKLFKRHSWTMPYSSETNCYGNIRAAHSYLTQLERSPPKHVILYGKSVGSGPTCWLAQRLCLGEDGVASSSAAAEGTYAEMCQLSAVPDGILESREPPPTAGGERSPPARAPGKDAPGGVVLHSPFLSVIRVVLDVGFTTVGDLFPNLDRVGDFTCPVYVIHGSDDAIVPFYHGQTLFQNLPDSSKTVPFWARGAGHNNIEMDMPTAYIKRLQQFVRQCDRQNYPSQSGSGSARKLREQKIKQQQMLLQASLQASLKQSMQLQHHPQPRVAVQQPQIHGSNAGTKKLPFPKVFHRPGILRYASAPASPQGGFPLAMPGDAAAANGAKTSKQRKQKGTLVMRSSHGIGHSSLPSLAAPMATANNWAVPAPSHNSLTAQQQQQQTLHQQQAHQQQQPQQHIEQYGMSNGHVRYHRSMSTSAMFPPPPHASPTSSLQSLPSSHHPPHHHQGPLHNNYPPQQQQQQQQPFSQQIHPHQHQQHQPKPLQYHPQARSPYVNPPHGGGGMSGWL